MLPITNSDEGIPALPTACIPGACRRVPGDGRELVEHFLNPDGIVVAEVND